MHGHRFYEGSEVIDNVVHGGLKAFKSSSQRERENWRQRAIDSIAKKCTGTGQLGIVTGHFSFWPENQVFAEDVYTPADLDIYTHILYLDTPADVVARRCLEDSDRARSPASVNHVRKWQDHEQTNLRRLCRENGILFGFASPTPFLLDSVLPLLHDIRLHSEEENLARASYHLDQTLLTMSSQTKPETVLVFDADKTLSDVDAGTMFWEKVKARRHAGDQPCPLKTLFSSSMGYSYASFRQAVFLYEETCSDFEGLCSEVASAVIVPPEFMALLRAVENNHVGAVVVTCGLRRVWEKILEREGLSGSVRVIGGGRIADGYVITPQIKAAVVSRLQCHHGLYVWAFGDSPMDLPMLKLADEAVVVVGEERSRSKSMDAALLMAVEEDGFRARQALVPNTAVPRLSVDKLPLVDVSNQRFIDSVARRRRLRVFHATHKNAANLLTTPTRDASVAGPKLREAHHRVGMYLAIEYVSDILGLEKYEMPHVQGHMTDGYQLFDGDKTAIVALMRGGEPMALGINDAFQKAMFLHARHTEDLNETNLEGKKTVLLVDSVVNSGKSIKEFVERVRDVDADIRIVVVAGVVQKRAVSGVLEQLASVADLSLVALRLSDNKFTGRGGTDTGNRLFNTTHLE